MNAPTPDSIDTAAFDRSVSLRDAYRIMERFVEDYLARGDLPVSDFLRTYAASTTDGRTTDPAAPGDFLRAAAGLLGSAGPNA